ncbi:MAG: O-antigen polymerase [Christensenellaceae bacterium]
MLVFLTLYILGCIYLLKNCSDKLNPMVWLIIAYSFITGMYFFSGVNYSNKASVSVFLYLTLNIGTFYFWFKYCSMPKDYLHSVVRNDSSIKIIPNRTLRNIEIIGYIGVVVYLFDFLRLNGVTNMLSLLSLHSSFKTSFLTVAASLMTPSLLVVWITRIVQITNRTKKFKLGNVSAIVAFSIPNILTSGRQSVLFALLVTAISFIYVASCNRKARSGVRHNNNDNRIWQALRKNKKRLIAIAVTLLIVTSSYMSYVAINRNTYSYKLESFKQVFDATVSDSTNRLCTEYGGLSDALIDFVFYYSHELPYLQILIDYYNGPYGFGMYQFHYIARRLAVLGVNPTIVDETLENMSRSRNVSDHLYRTVLGSAICDFGLIGTVLFISILGYLSGRAYKRYKRQKSTWNIVNMIYICACVVFSIEYSPFREPAIAYTLLWIMIIRKRFRYENEN